MTLRYIGPIAVTFHGDPTYDWDGATTADGFEAVTIGGYLEWSQAQQLKELVKNRHRRITLGGAQGVPEVIWADDELLAPTNGWYLLDDCHLPATQSDTVGGAPVPFSLAAVYLGADRKPIIEHSDRALPNDYGVTPQASIADPYPMADSIVVSPGGTRRLVEYDPEPHDSARVAVMAAEMAVYTAGVGVLDLVTPLAPGF